jgi:hypothetical protein
LAGSSPRLWPQVVSAAAAEDIQTTLTATIVATAATEAPIPTVATKMGIRIREVLRIHIIPAIRTECELTRIEITSSMPKLAAIAVNRTLKVSILESIATTIPATILREGAALREIDRVI